MSFDHLTTLGIIVTIMTPILQMKKLRNREESNLSKVTQPVSGTAGIETLLYPILDSEHLTMRVRPSPGT